jgi:adenylate kinase
MSNQIKVYVTGVCGSGKSTITEIIARALTEQGIMTETSIIQNEHPVYRPESFKQRVESLKQKETLVHLEEKQAPRSKDV